MSTKRRPLLVSDWNSTAVDEHGVVHRWSIPRQSTGCMSSFAEITSYGGLRDRVITCLVCIVQTTEPW